MLKKTSLILALSLLAVPAMAEDLTLDQIIAKNVEARGGADAWESVKTAKIEGTMTMGGGAMTMPVSMTFERPGKVRFEMEMQGQKIVQAYDGESGWQIMPLMGSPDPQAMSEDESKNVKRQSDFEGPLYNYKEKGHSVELEGKEEVEGTEAYKLKITLKSGDVVHTFLDTEYFLEFKQIYKVNGPTGEMVMNTMVGDYKEVGPVVLAHSMEMLAEGAPEGTGMSISFDNVEINPEVDGAIFDMPKVEEKAAAEGGR